MKEVELISAEQQAEYIELIREYVVERFANADLDVDIAQNARYQLYGSRINGGSKDGSDLDVLMEYDCPMDEDGYMDSYYREDGLFNLLNDDDEEGGRLYIDGIPIDINPINEYESGTIADHMSQHEKWREEDAAEGKNYTLDKTAEAVEPVDYEEPTGEMKSGNHAVLNKTGERFWIGAVNLLDGEIEDVYTYREAKAADFHHTFYFGPNALDMVDNQEAIVFFVQPRRTVVIWDNYDAPDLTREQKSHLVARIKEQITFK